MRCKDRTHWGFLNEFHRDVRRSYWSMATDDSSLWEPTLSVISKFELLRSMLDLILPTLSRIWWRLLSFCNSCTTPVNSKP